MADDDPQRQRLEDMLKASEQRRKPGPGAEAGGETSSRGRSGDSSGAEAAGEDGPGGPARATGSASTMVVWGLVLGGLSIVAGLLFWPLGVLLAIAAIVLGVLVGRRATDVRAKVALGLGLAGVVASVVGFVIFLNVSEDGGNGSDDSEEDDGGSDSDEGDGGSDDDGGDDGDDGDDGDSDGGDSSSSLAPPRVVAFIDDGVVVVRSFGKRDKATSLFTTSSLVVRFREDPGDSFERRRASGRLRWQV